MKSQVVLIVLFFLSLATPAALAGELTCTVVVGGASLTDTDCDAIDDKADKCPSSYNPDQRDTDGDGIGDACDNCWQVANANQVDSDDDGFGNACENDADGDGIEDDKDNCPSTSNPGQENTDGDSKGDACEVSTAASAPVTTSQSQTTYPEYGAGCGLAQANGGAQSVALIGLLLLVSLIILARRKVKAQR